MLRIIQHSTFTRRQLEQSEYVPLKQVRVKSIIRSFAADVTIKQVFRNDETTPIEAVYCFPIEEQAAVYAFIARIDDREIVAQLKEKKEAQEEYSDALRQGHGAYLLEQDEKSQDNFIINVGALPPGKECHITISYVSELDLIDHGRKIRFVVPTTIAPRYNPNKGGIASPAGTMSKYIQTTPYVIEFYCKVDKKGISRVSSISHPIQVDFAQADIYVVEFSQKNTHLDRDILLDIDLAEKQSNILVTAEPGVVMASFIPTEDDCRRAANNIQISNEYLFVIDCSGSMDDENKIELARQSMLLFLKSLPINCYFNIIRFGSSYETLFKDVTVIYNEENARKAEQLANEMQADLGGTELLSPLQWLEEYPPDTSRARQIFLLTDGEISNVDEVLDLCRSMATSTRIFSFGLGHAPSRSLVKGLARATNGRFVFIPPNTNIDIYVGEQLQKALQPCITDVQVKWNLGTTVMNVPTKTPPVYANDRLIIYALENDRHSTVELHTNQHRLCEAQFNRVSKMSNNGTIARLAAKALILELQHAKISPSMNKNVHGSLQTRFEKSYKSLRTSTINDKEAIKKQILELSLKYQILSPYTAFVGVEKRTNASNANMVLREVPIQISNDDQHLIENRYQHIYHSNIRTQDSSINIERCLMRNNDIDNNHSYSSYIRPMISNQLISECRTTRVEQQGINHTRSFDSYTDPRTYRTMHNENIRKEETWPVDDQNIVRYLINKQKFDGLWDLNAKEIEKLTGKTLTSFQSFNNHQQILVSAIVIVSFETRFSSLLIMWHGVVQKARKRLLDLLNNDSKQLDLLLRNIRQQF